jgi:mannosyltransferase
MRGPQAGAAGAAPTGPPAGKPGAGQETAGQAPAGPEAVGPETVRPGTVRPETVRADAVGPVRANQGNQRERSGSISFPGWLLFVLPALAELIVGGYRIAGPSLWRDEAATISGSQRPVGAIFALMRDQDAVHGPYYLVMHVVIAIAGISETALRLPSLIAMSLAVGLTALLGRRLAQASALLAPGAVGLVAGLLLVMVPLTTRYAQEARPYALTTLFAVLATYLLVRAAPSGRWPWWAAYAAALVLTGLFNLFAVLIALAHGISLAAATRAADADASAAETPARGALARWLTACAAAAVLLAPLAYFSVRQSAQLNWVTTPNASTFASLIRDFAGSTLLIPVAVLVGALGCVAGRGVRRGGGLTLAIIALPWLIVPPVVLLAASFVHPVYVERYVVFCIPALSLLAAAGLIWLVKLTQQEVGRRGVHGQAARLMSVAPSAALAVIVVAGLVGPQIQIRQSSARADNLRVVAAVVAAHERPGDAILYLPWDTAVVGMAYPAPFNRLRDIELGESPAASATLRGLPTGLSVVAARLATVTRVWTVQWAQPLTPSAPAQTDVFAAGALARMQLVQRWRIASVVLSLYSSG